jgi:peptidoglycan/xylan/chitin deacetylase (PgdA/CDA1 family)
MDEGNERKHMKLATDIIRKMSGGKWPLGWYTGRDSPNTRRLVADHGGYAYDSDYYGDDLPFWMPVEKTDGSVEQRLVLPYTLDANDMRFAAPQGFNTADHFFSYLRDSFDVLYAEGERRPKMMSVGMHCRILGKPGRIRGLQKFLDHIQSHDKVWVCRRIDIAEHWKKHFPAPA